MVSNPSTSDPNPIRAAEYVSPGNSRASISATRKNGMRPSPIRLRQIDQHRADPLLASALDLVGGAYTGRGQAELHDSPVLGLGAVAGHPPALLQLGHEPADRALRQLQHGAQIRLTHRRGALQFGQRMGLRHRHRGAAWRDVIAMQPERPGEVDDRALEIRRLHRRGPR